MHRPSTVTVGDPLGFFETDCHPGERRSVDPYGGNPFRVLGVRSSASGKEAARGADRLLKWIEIGESPQVERSSPIS